MGRGSPPRNGGLGAAARMSRGVCPVRACAPPTHPHPSARARPTLTPAHFPILHSHLAECQACFHPQTPTLTPMPVMRCVFGCGRQQGKKKKMSCTAVPPIDPSKKRNGPALAPAGRPRIRRAHAQRLVYSRPCVVGRALGRGGVGRGGRPPRTGRVPGTRPSSAPVFVVGGSRGCPPPRVAPC